MVAQRATSDDNSPAVSTSAGRAPVASEEGIGAAADRNAVDQPMQKSRINVSALKSALADSCAELDRPRVGPSEIVDGFLFVGDIHHAECQAQLLDVGITHVLSVTTNEALGAGPEQVVTRLFLRARDDETENIGAYFTPACEFFDLARQSGGRVLVHCLAGRSRSATLTIAYLMRREGMRLAEAFSYAKKRRPLILPNVGFWEQLMAEEQRLFGENGDVPYIYQKVLSLRIKEREVSPKHIFKSYITAYLLGDTKQASEERDRVIGMWPEGWAVANSVEEILLSAAVDETCDAARPAAVHMMARLLELGRFTVIEVQEGFRQFDGADFDDLRLDAPMVDSYAAELRTEAITAGLLPGCGRC